MKRTHDLTGRQCMVVKPFGVAALGGNTGRASGSVQFQMSDNRCDGSGSGSESRVLLVHYAGKPAEVAVRNENGDAEVLWQRNSANGK
jgi:hypothetical protein